jgi:hypothetical protein
MNTKNDGDGAGVKNVVARIVWQPSVTTFFSVLRTNAYLQRYASFSMVVVSVGF